jgi:hypothetical protein
MFWDYFDDIAFDEVLKLLLSRPEEVRGVLLLHRLMKDMVSGSEVALMTLTSFSSYAVVAKASISPGTSVSGMRASKPNSSLNLVDLVPLPCRAR